MATRFKEWALALICFTFASPVLADDLLNTTNSYVAVNAGMSKSEDTCTYTYVAGATCSENSKIYRIAYGYNFTPAWGMEISYGDFGVAKEEGTFPDTPAGITPYEATPTPYVWTWDAVGWEIAGTGTLHLGDSFSLIGKLGVYHAQTGSELMVTTQTSGLWHAVSHEDSTGTSAGISAQYDINRDFAMRIQYQNFGKIGTVTKTKVSAATAGIVLKF
jgi:OOP family OmpA-OmpF porin